MDKPIYLDNIDEYFLKSGKGNVYKEAVWDLEGLLIEKALERTNGNQIEAASLLGLNRNTLRYKIKQFKINVNRYKR